tara:strand:+ start:17125 stop:17625 length:501 start_codon:yes stop_codon:yes gene_type:complete
MIKYKYLLGLLILSLGACQSHHMDQKMGHKENSKHPTTLEEFEEWKREEAKRILIKKKAFEKGDYATAFNFVIEDSQKTKGFTLNAIGTMYHFGYGVEVDYKRAKDLYERALEYGNGEAANHLGRLYLNGEGVEKNENRATEYYKISCDNGCDLGCKNYKTWEKLA